MPLIVLPKQLDSRNPFRESINSARLYDEKEKFKKLWSRTNLFEFDLAIHAGEDIRLQSSDHVFSKHVMKLFDLIFFRNDSKFFQNP